MPLKRKIIRIGSSSAITIPATWLKLIREKHGSVTHVSIEVNDHLLVKPLLPFFIGQPLQNNNNLLIVKPLLPENKG